MDTYSAGPHEFEFDWHTSGHSGPRHFAINVKFKEWSADLPEGYTERHERMVRAEYLKPDQIEEWAWQNAAESWWDWAQEIADEYELGKVFGAGRSGGWLILDKVTVSDIETLCEEYNSECLGCGYPYEDYHLGLKCLYNSTTWVSSNEENLEKLQNLVKFQEDIAASKDWANEMYDDQMRWYIDEEWRQYQAERKRERDEKRNRRAAGLGGPDRAGSPA